MGRVGYWPARGSFQSRAVRRVRRADCYARDAQRLLIQRNVSGRPRQGVSPARSRWGARYQHGRRPGAWNHHRHRRAGACWTTLGQRGSRRGADARRRGLRPPRPRHDRERPSRVPRPSTIAARGHERRIIRRRATHQRLRGRERIGGFGGARGLRRRGRCCLRYAGRRYGPGTGSGARERR